MAGAITGFPGNLPPAWRTRLSAEKDKDYFKSLVAFLNSEHDDGQIIFPQTTNVLRALQTLDLPGVRVVILGQDPYHRRGQAVGLSFAVPNELKPKPPSLKNIFKEIASDLGIDMSAPASDLSGWVKQGVLLLNTVLTVREGQAFSHRHRGWESFTDAILRALNDRPEPIVFLLWGDPARKKRALVNANHHIVLEAPHPSPLSAYRGFFGSKHFSKANQYLSALGSCPIDWSSVSCPSSAT